MRLIAGSSFVEIMNGKLSKNEVCSRGAKELDG